MCERYGFWSTPTGRSTPPRNAAKQHDATGSRHKIRHNFGTPIGDLAELARVLAGLTLEERDALLALAKGLRSPPS